MPTRSATQHGTDPAASTVSTRRAREVLGSVGNTLAERRRRGGRWAGRVSRPVGSPENWAGSLVGGVRG
jgi:hypothetical protein